MRANVFVPSLWLLVACAVDAAPPPVAAPPASAPHAEVGATPPKLRLPEVARPTRVDLDLTLDPEAPKFSGVFAADLDVLQPTDVLWLNANDLTLGAIEIASGNAVQKGRVIATVPDFVGIAFDQKIAAGKARLTLRYEGVVDRDKARGIYAMQEPDGARYAYTFFEPVDARRAFPCFDEPNYKTPWKLTLHVPKGDVARANSAVAAEHDEANGKKAVVFEESKPLPSYLVAFVVGPFDVVNAPDAGHNHTKLAFLVPKGRGAETRYAAEVTPKIIGNLEDYFGMPYPWGKLDVAVVPREWGTMEHPGIVALGQPLTLIKTAEETSSRKERYANIATHELAHYWFGDYVTMKWWDDTWLNESMAQWMDSKLTGLVDPTWNFGRIRLERADAAMHEDALASAKRIREPVVTDDEIANAFDGALTYDKGNAVFHMFEQWMTVPVLQRAIRHYLDKHAWGSVVEDDLVAAFDAEVAGAGAALKTFVDQPGVPFVEAKLVCEGDTRAIELAQRRYAPAGVTLAPERWSVPVCVRYGDAKGAVGKACTLLATPSARVKVDAKACPTWVVTNAGAAGYYRSRYSKKDLDAIFRARASLDDAELTMVMHDAGALVDSGDLSLADALALVPNVVDAKDRYVFQSVYAILGVAGPITTDAERPKFAHYLGATFGKRARALGWKPRAGESKDDEALRPRLLATAAIGGEDPELQKQAKDLVKRWLVDRAALDNEIVDVALAAAAKTDDAALFDEVLAQASKSKDQTEKERLYTALGAFRDSALVKRAQALLVDERLNLHDTQGILWAQFEDRRTRDAAYGFFDAKFEALRARLREDEAMWLFYTPRFFCDGAHAAAIEAAFTPRAKQTPGAPRTLEGSLETMRLCIAKARAHGPALASFLARY